MIAKEAIETIALYIRTHHGARENGKSRICEALNAITSAFEKAEKYRWHDLRKNPEAELLQCDIEVPDKVHVTDPSVLSGKVNEIIDCLWEVVAAYETR